jgi:hypothetical protein
MRCILLHFAYNVGSGWELAASGVANATVGGGTDGPEVPAAMLMDNAGRRISDAADQTMERALLDQQRKEKKKVRAWCCVTAHGIAGDALLSHLYWG